MKIEEDGTVFEGNRSSDVTSEVAEGTTENSYASYGQRKEESLDLESFEMGSSERGFRRVWIQIQAQEIGGNRHVVLFFPGELVKPKSPAKKTSSLKLKSSTFLTVTSQLVGSLLAVSKPGPCPPAQVETVLITSVLFSSFAFLLFLFGLWLKTKSPVGAWRLEMVGCAFTVASFIGMATIVFF